jgi:hypothetical protein
LSSTWRDARTTTSEALPGHQFVGGASFNHLPRSITTTSRSARSVEGGASIVVRPTQVVERLLDFLFGLGIDRRVASRRGSGCAGRSSSARAIGGRWRSPPGEALAALADQRVVGLRQPQDNSCACAARAAAILISTRLAPGLP